VDIRRVHASKRSAAIEGFWKGGGRDFYVENGQPFADFELRLNFTKKGRRFNAKGGLTSDIRPQANTTVELAGGFYNDDLLQFTYRSEDPTRKQMGVIVFVLSDGGRRLDGHYAGFSPTRGAFVAGDVFLEKQSP
jgi:hypothetical protein